MGSQYWVVGAMFGGSDDYLKVFSKQGLLVLLGSQINYEIPPTVTDLFPKDQCW